jgi:transposase
VLVELGLVEQRYKAVSEVLDGATVTDVARRYGVARQTVHEWLRRYAAGGLAALVDKSSRPGSCPHQMAPEVEARILELRRAHPGWGPRTIAHRLARDGLDPVPRALVDPPLPGPPRPHHAPQPPAPPPRLQALGAGPPHPGERFNEPCFQPCPRTAPFGLHPAAGIDRGLGCAFWDTARA